MRGVGSGIELRAMARDGSGHEGKWQLINAAASVMVVPMILLFLIVRKHVVKAIAVGAVKG